MKLKYYEIMKRKLTSFENHVHFAFGCLQCFDLIFCLVLCNM